MSKRKELRHNLKLSLLNDRRVMKRSLNNGVFIYLSKESNKHVRQLAAMYGTSMSAIVDELLFTMRIGSSAREKKLTTKKVVKKSRKN